MKLNKRNRNILTVFSDSADLICPKLPKFVDFRYVFNMILN